MLVREPEVSMQTRTSQETEKQRERARIAADLAEFLRRGGEIEEVVTSTSTGCVRPGANAHSPVHAANFADD